MGVDISARNGIAGCGRCRIATRTLTEHANGRWFYFQGSPQREARDALDQLGRVCRAKLISKNVEV